MGVFFDLVFETAILPSGAVPCRCRVKQFSFRIHRFSVIDLQVCVGEWVRPSKRATAHVKRTNPLCIRTTEFNRFCFGIRKYHVERFFFILQNIYYVIVSKNSEKRKLHKAVVRSKLLLEKKNFKFCFEKTRVETFFAFNLYVSM